MKKWFRSAGLRLLLISLLCLPVLLLIFNRVYPEASIILPVSKQEMRSRAESFLGSLGYDMTGYSCDIKLVRNTGLLEHALKQARSQAELRLYTDSLNAYLWEFKWNSRIQKNDDTLEVRVVLGDERSNAMRDCFLSMSPGGYPVEMELRTLPDSTGLYGNLDRSQIEARLFRLLHPDSSEWNAGKTEQMRNMAGEITRTQWSRKKPVAGLKTHFALQMSGTRILAFRTESVLPEKKADGDPMGNLIDILSFLLAYLLIVILGIVFLIKRLRSDLMDLICGFVPGLVIALCWSVIYWHNTGGMEKSWESWLGFIITLPFISGSLWALFALGESFTREVHPEQLRVVDQLRKGAWTAQLGQALVNGILLGIICLTLHAVLWMANIKWFGGYVLPNEPVLSIWSSPVPVLLLFASSMMSGLFITVTYCLFYFSLLRRYSRHFWIVIVLVSVVWSMISLPITECASNWLRFPVNILLGLFIIGIFMRSEFFTVLFTVVFSTFFYQTAVFFTSRNTFYRNQSLILAGLIVALAVWGLWLLFRKRRIRESSGYVPDYMRRITHRKELQKELEIARNVQVNLLPQQNPGIPGLDIASLCVPAREVGGDYFDFVCLGKRKLGIVIGDVSGKGIPAAFYMTLTKGLLKSKAAGDASPKDVLIQLNQLFFENSKRGVFISMIYAVLDLEKGSMVMARAGHNPMLLVRAGVKKPEEICPPGIAIGFERGTVFEKTIEEVTLAIRPGDMILFYTDGLNEAQNPEHEALGENCLQQLLTANADLSAQGAADAILEAIQRFTGDAEQHDDMTAVLVKVLPDGSGPESL